MTFTKFESFQSWLFESTENKEIEATEFQDETNAVKISNIQNCDPIILMDIILSAYDSNYYLGSWDYEYDNGTLIIYE
jgi:hypothetical protein